MDILGYFKSILEEAKPYARMKLMLVGLQGKGKTSLLDQMRHEGSSGSRRRPPEHWTKRMGHTSRNNLKNQKGVTLSTVGVDIHDWIYQKKVPRNQQSFGPVSFSTWDFAGQEEFHATHRYFLSRRSIYLVIWRITDGLDGILGIQQWLLNIQSHAPGSPVIIVGTHVDMIEGGERSDLVQKLQAEVHQRFIDVPDHDKSGLPKIIDSISVSARTKYNVKYLCNRIYDVAFSLRCPGTTERLLEQQIPATYLYLEEIISSIVHECHEKRREPVLNYEEYKKLTSEQLKLKYNKTFRDLEPLGSREINYASELQQATRFLHENGVLLHYEDSNLRDFYFLDPQWLCDILSHVVTIPEVNPHVKYGLMKIDDLGHLFKSIEANLSGSIQSYVVNLLNKFEVALTWNSQYLIIPSLLPSNPDLLGEPREFQVKLAPRARGRSLVRRHDMNRSQALRSTSIDPIKKAVQQQQHQQSDRANLPKNFYEFEYRPEEAITRIILLRYLPAGFLARLQSAILSDSVFDEACEDIQLSLIQSVTEQGQSDMEFANLLGARPGWLCWKRGIRLKLQTESTINTKLENALLPPPELLTIQELSSTACDTLLNKIDFKIESSQVIEDADQEKFITSAPIKTQWMDFDINEYSNIITITLPKPKLKVTSKDDRSVRMFELNHLTMAKLLTKAVDYIDDLLEDWYPTLGARFARTFCGSYLVTRVAPCPACSNIPLMLQALGSPISPKVNDRSSRSARMPMRNGIKFSMGSARERTNSNTANINQVVAAENLIYCYYVEHCILNAYDITSLSGRGQSKFSNMFTRMMKTSPTKVRDLQCPRHGPIPLVSLSPDILFNDLPDQLKIDNDQIERCKLIGRGALGFVFKGSLRSTFPLNELAQSNQEVALKLLQPVDPGPEAEQADKVAYNSAKITWSREPFQCACKSYCTARHEVNILQTISHPNIVAFIGICLRPLAIVLELAPLGSLADIFKNYKSASSRIDQFTVQKSILQVARALEFLHQQRVIYRDLKTENILVWSFPSPFATKYQTAQVELKLADYGISRQALSTGIWKGFAGTMSYLAPEILRHNGDEEYTEKVDCFSFGMFNYELLTLRRPYELSENAVGAGASRCQFSLQCGRPVVRKSDFNYPNYMLDLMSFCLSQEPHDRPTASQIVSIASAPEFMQIYDSMEIEQTLDIDQLSFASLIDYSNSLELWLGEATSQGSINILSNHQDQWERCEQVEPNNPAQAITSMCLVGGNIWLCDSSGQVHVTAAVSRHNTRADLDDQSLSSLEVVGPKLELEVSSFTLQDRRGQPVKMGQVKTALYIEVAKCVVFLTSSGFLWVCKLATMICEQLEDSAIKYNCLAVPPNGIIESSLPISPSSGLSSGADSQPSSLDSTSPPCFPLFCGQSNGISCLEICDGEVRRQSILPLAGRGAQTAQSEDFIDDTPTSAEITHIVVTGDKGEYLWTAANCVVHLWSRKVKHVIRKLDCWRLVPCSESLESINIEQYYQAAKLSHVTSMVQLQDQLFVGTSHGCIIVIEASTLNPMTVFRPFESQATILRPISTSQNNEQSDSIDQDSSGRRLVAFGQGYRNLMQRYLASNALNTNGEQGGQSCTGERNKLVAVLLTTLSGCNL